MAYHTPILNDLHAAKLQQSQQPQASGGFKLADLIPIAGGVLGGVGGSFVGGPVGTVAGGAAGQGLGQYLENLLTGESGSKDVLQQTLLGGAAGAGGELLGVAGKALGIGGKAAGETVAKEGTSLAAKAGNSLLKSVVNPKVGASPFGAAGEDALVQSAQKLGLKGTSANMYKQLGSTFDNLSTTISDILGNSSATVSKKDLAGKIVASISENPSATLDKAYLKSIVRDISSLGGKNGEIGVQDLFSYKQKLGSLLKRAFNKLDSPNAVLTPKEETALSAWKQLAGAVGEAEPQVSHLTSLQSDLFDLAPGLKANIGKGGIGIKGINLPGTASITQGAKSLAGNALLRAGGPTSTGTKLGSQAVTQLLAGGVPKALSGSNQSPAGTDPYQQLLQGGQPGQDVSVQQPAQPTGGLNKETLARLIIADIGSTGGKHLAELKAIGDLLIPKDAAPQKKTSQQQRDMANAQSGIEALGVLRHQLASDPSVLLKASIPGSFGARTFDTARKEASDVLTRLRTGAALNKSEEAFYKSQMPNVFDDAQTIQYKLKLFETLFNRIAGQQADGGTSAAAVPQE